MSSLWRNRNFNTFWFSQTLSVAGDSFSLMAVPLLVLHATGSVAKMGLLTGLSAAGSLVTGFFAGAIVDRFDRRRLLITADVARMLLYGSVPLTWLIGPQIWLLYVVVPIAACFGMLFQVGYVTAVSNLVPREQITEANGRLFGSQAAAGVGGLFLAGLISAAFGPSVAIGIDAVTFGVSGAALMLVRLKQSGGAVIGEVEKANPWKGFQVGARFLWTNPVLRALTLLLVVYHFFYLGVTDVVIYYVQKVLMQPDSTVGYVMAVAALGTVAGALVVGPLRRRFGFGVCWIVPNILVGIAIAAIGLTSSVVWIALLAMAAFNFSSIAGICSMSLRQQITPDHLLGRVTSAYWTLQQALAPVGAMVLTAATARFGVMHVLLIAGATLAASGVAAAFTPIRQARPEGRSEGGPEGNPGSLGMDAA